MERTIGVALGAVSVIGIAIAGRKRPAMAQPLDQIRIGDEGDTKGCEIDDTAGKTIIRLGEIETARQDQRASIGATKALEKACWHCRRPAAGLIHQMDIGYVAVDQFSSQLQERFIFTGEITKLVQAPEG